ncbi:MAG: HDOD domain-containing protein [Sulfuricella sp.]|nr:HDOD domain-containing protein [Sulfuricella sp.]
MKALGEWLVELKDWDSPVLRRTILDLGKLAAKMEKVSANQIADVVLRDPLMTLKVLRLVNNMSRGRLSHEITTVEHAVMMLGVGPFFNRHADLKSIEENIPPVDGALPELMRVFGRAYHAAWQARNWAIMHADMKSEEVYIGAFIYDLGEIVLWAYAPHLATQILTQSRRKKISLAEVEKAILGFELRELQFALAEMWNLPEMFQEFMHSESATRPRILGVVMAASVARHAESGWYGAQLTEDYEVVAGLLRLPFDETVSIIHRNAIASARHWEWYGARPAAAWLPMLPGDWPTEPGDEEETRQPEVRLMPPPDVLNQIMAEIAAHLDGTLDLHDMMALVLKGMHEGIGLNRVVFALLAADRSTLKAKYVVGAEPDSPLRQFQIDVTTRHLFSRLMEKVQGIWHNASNRNALEPMIPFEVRQLVGHGEFFAMSVFLHGKPIGLFYADSMHDGGALDEHRYLEFKQLCLRAAQGLAHLAKKK